MDRNVRVILNNKEVYGFQGQKILDLCAECGVEIPTLCYDPHLSVHGGCSVCLVDVKGAKALVRACANTITPGMVIDTNNEKVNGARKLALELLLSDHVGDCRPPCTLTCPANGNVQAYINQTAQGKYREALDTLHHHVTLPASIGRVCPAPCQEKCRRNFVDEEPVSIREIKRFVADWAIERNDLGNIPHIEENGKSVAVVGGGPAGVSAAYFLRLHGYRVTIFEREEKLGGMMRYGIPDYRLPQDVIQKEIDWLLAHGVDVRTNTGLGRDITLDELREEYDSVLLAMGCWKSSPMKVTGEDLPGVVGGIDFLYTVNKGRTMKVGKRVAVIGGGNTAMDACRCAVRSGAEKVYIVYRRTREEMPAEKLEIEEAVQEGVEFLFLAAPVAVEGNGKVERLVCERMELGAPDASGRRSPVPTGERFTLDVDMVIAAIGQGIDFTGLPKDIQDGRKMKADDNYATPLSGVFVCGDQQTGPKIAIQAIGNGHWAADSIHAYLTTGVAKKPFFYDIVRNDLGPADFADREKQPREHVHEVEASVRLSKPFDEYNAGLSEEQVLRDSKRCMECACADVFECKLRKYATDYEVRPERVAGAHVKKFEDANAHYVRNMDKCILCGRCVRACDEIAGFHAIDFAKRGLESVLTPQFFKAIDDSDCTYCGLCTQVCPVGALMEKRVERKPHLDIPIIEKTTCAKCSLGCTLDINLDQARDRIVRITTDLGDTLSPTRGHCCVKGRYGFEDITTDRLSAPRLRGSDASWGDAVDAFSSILKETPKEKTAFFSSAGLTNEEMAALKRFASGSPVAVTDADDFRPGIEHIVNAPALKGAGAGYDDLYNADCYVLLASNTDEEQPVLTSWIRRGARKNGARVVYVGRTAGILDKGDSIILVPKEGMERAAVKALAVAVIRAAGAAVPEELVPFAPETMEEKTGIEKARFDSAAAAIVASKRPATLVGRTAASCNSCSRAIASLLQVLKVHPFLLLFGKANTQGAIALELGSTRLSDLLARVREGSVETVVLAGVCPSCVGLTESDLSRAKNVVVLTSRAFPEIGRVSITLPLLAWAEKEGTYTTVTGRTAALHVGPVPPAQAKSLRRILALAGRAIGLDIDANALVKA